MKHSTSILFLALCMLLFACSREEAVPVQKFQVENESVSASYHTADVLIDMSEEYTADTYYLLYAPSTRTNDQQRAKLTSDGSKLSGRLTNLTEGTTYYYRLSIVGDFNTVTLEPQYSFTTKEYTDPVVRTDEVLAVTHTSAIVAIALDEWGCDALPQWGLCYATEPNPTTADTKVKCTDNATSNITLTSLTDSTMYYVRAYATNARGTAYGQELAFRTLACARPTVLTADCRFVTTNGTILYGEVTSNGGLEVTERGFCYATTANPTVSDNRVQAGIAGTGQYSCALTGLQAATTYYVRAYALNSKGISYGNQLTFTTINN